MKPSFLLFGTGVSGNYGCEAIVRGTERILDHRFPEADIILPVSLLRAGDGRILGAGSRVKVACLVNWWSPLYALRVLGRRLGVPDPKAMRVPPRLVRSATCVLSIGGDLYTFAEKEKDWPFPYPIVDAGNAIMRMGTPYVIWCASVGPLEKAGSRLGEIVEHLKACRAVIVRESGSYHYLRDQIGLRDNVYLAADPAFSMEPKEFDAPFLRKKDVPVLAVNFSRAPIEHVYGHVQTDEVRVSLSHSLMAVISSLKVRVLLVPHVRDDHGFLGPIYNEIRSHVNDRIWMLPENIGAQKTKWAVSQCNGLLTMRFHCALDGIGTGTPTMVLVSTTKGAKICKDTYGNLEWALNIRDAAQDILLERVCALLDSEESLRQRLSVVQRTMKARALSAADVLSDVVWNGGSTLTG